jgi:hypothetical protein
VFIVIGVVGVALLIFALLFDEILDGVLPDSEWLSVSSLSVFLSGLGLVGAASESLNAPTPVAWAAGVGAGCGLGAVAVWMTRSLAAMTTDETPTEDDLLGQTGRVVTAVPAGSVGEAVFQLGGQPVKVSALGPDRGVHNLEVGREVLVVDVLSSTRVRVEPVDLHGLGSG